MVMSSNDVQLSGAAIDALQQGKVIEAIKLVRTEHALGLKEAKDVVDAYVRNHPELQDALTRASDEGKRKLGFWLAIVIGIGLLAWFLYRPK
jgi:ribosomal protein L7/L12